MIIVLTDFTKRALHAAEYATYIALKNKANLVLCHAMELTSELADGVELNWPVADQLVKKKEESIQKLEDLKQTLTKIINRNHYDFTPAVEYVTDFGLLDEVAENVISERSADLVVIGTHKSNGFSRFLFGSHTHTVLDKIDRPVLLVPENINYRGVNSIAYATDLSFNNNQVINYLIRLAKAFNASVSVNHISPFEFPVTEAEQSIRTSLKQYLQSFDPPVFYHNVKGYSVKSSLLEITGSGKADILALVHKRYDFFERLFHASISKQMADSTTIPLLVLPYSFSIEKERSLLHGEDQSS